MLLGVEGVIVFWGHTPFGRHNLISMLWGTSTE
jgi:hypothetical protein